MNRDIQAFQNTADKSGYTKMSHQKLLNNELLNLNQHPATAIGIVTNIQERESANGRAYRCILADYLNDGHGFEKKEQISFINDINSFNELVGVAQSGRAIIVSGGDLYFAKAITQPVAQEPAPATQPAYVAPPAPLHQQPVVPQTQQPAPQVAQVGNEPALI